MLSIFKKNKHNKYSFRFLNATQFLGALNDNLFKLLIVFFLISIQGVKNANIILSLAGAIFVIPFLLFSAAAGVLADRFSKKYILVSMKIAEILIMLSSIFAISLKSPIFIYSLLFMMAAQSSFFGPSKYGIIPEIVEEKKISSANGILTSFTYLAIIIGTFLASAITDITEKNFIIASFFCVAISIAGFLFSLKIEKTEAKKTKKRISPLFVYEIYKTLKFSKSIKHMLPIILASSFFLFIGGFVQLNTIPFAITSLHLTEVGGGYIFLSTAIGISFGAITAGKISKEKIEIGLSCLSGFVIAILLFLLGLFPKNLYFSIFILLFLGFFGGLFLIPLDAFIQKESPHKKRGQLIASSSFLSFLGVLFSAAFLYFTSEILQISSAKGFIALAIVVFIFNVFISKYLLFSIFSFIERKFLKKYFISFQLENNIQNKNKSTFILLDKNIILQIFFLLSKLENLEIIFFPKKFFKNFIEKKENIKTYVIFSKKNIIHINNLQNKNLFSFSLKKIYLPKKRPLITIIGNFKKHI